MAYAFRCKNCKRLETSAYAGVRDLPARCSVCGAGVSFTPDGIKTYDDSNWEVLADLPEDELAAVLDYHKLDPSEIEVHVPAVEDGAVDRVPVSLHAVASEGVGTEDVQ
jgi:hypothetical protein